MLRNDVDIGSFMQRPNPGADLRVEKKEDRHVDNEKKPIHVSRRNKVDT